MRFRTWSTLVLVLLVALTLPAAGQSRSGFMLFGGIGMPAGEFGKTDGADAGFAKQGYFGGAEIMFSLLPGFGLVLDGRYMMHKLNEEELLKASGGPSGASLTAGSFTGMLPMGGVRFYMSLPISIFVDAQAGYMFAKSPEITYSYGGFSQKVESQNGKGLAYAASAGVDLGNTFVVGASYIISKPKFESTTGSGASAVTTTMEQQMNVIQVFAGIRF